MKKKYGLFKVLAVLLLLIVIATCFIKNRSGEIKYLALVDVFFNYVQSYYYFFDTALFIFAVGGFYGVLNRIPAYKKVIYGLSKKYKDKSKLFLIIVTVMFAIIASLTGFNLIMLLFIPFFVSVILLLGYDKLIALSATVGASLVGFLGGVFVTFKDSSSQYATTYTNFAKLAGLENMWDVKITLPVCILLVIGIVLLVIHMNQHLKEDKKDKYDLIKSDPLLVELKDKNGKKIVKNDSKAKTWPFLVVMGVMFVLLILGYIPWNTLFKISVFNDFHTWLTGLSIGKYVVFTSLISETISAFGTWSDLGSYMMVIFLMFFFSAILVIIYRVKFDDAMDGFVYGVKKVIPAAMIAMLAYCVLVCSYNNGFIETIITGASKKFGDNVIINSLVSMLGSVLNVDLYYTTVGVFGSITSSLPDKYNIPVYAVMYQSMFGFVQFVGPTSLLLVASLSYLEVPYKAWLKYIWRFVVELLIAIFILLMVVSIL